MSKIPSMNIMLKNSTGNELEALIQRHFPAHRLLGQKLMFHSAIWSMDGINQVGLDQVSAAEINSPAIHLGFTQPPMYFIALCAADADQPAGYGWQLWLFDDREESVYQHYHGEIRRNMAAGGIIAGLEKEIEELKRESRLRKLYLPNHPGGNVCWVKPEADVDSDHHR